MLFTQGKAISEAPIIRRTSQFPKNPVIISITIKKMITNAYTFAITLQIWPSSSVVPGWLNSAQINKLRAVSTIPAQAPNSKQKVPTSS